eukprot:776858-Pyramimonas_sp.AAC.1
MNPSVINAALGPLIAVRSRSLCDCSRVIAASPVACRNTGIIRRWPRHMLTRLETDWELRVGLALKLFSQATGNLAG